MCAWLEAIIPALSSVLVSCTAAANSQWLAYLSAMQTRCWGLSLRSKRRQSKTALHRIDSQLQVFTEHMGRRATVALCKLIRRCCLSICRSKQIKVHCGLFFLCVQACVASAGKIDGCMNMKNAVIRKNSHGSRYNDLLGCRHAHAHKIRMGSKREIKGEKVCFRQY